MPLMRYRPLGSVPDDGKLGRFIPDDFEHYDKYPAKLALPEKAIAVVEKRLILPSWHWEHNQGEEGSCVPHGIGMERAVTNIAQNRAGKKQPFTRRYDPLENWDWSKAHDEWKETNPGDDNGTSVRAGYEYQRVVGPRKIGSRGITVGPNGRPKLTATPGPNELGEGVQTYRWASTVDEMRAAIDAGLPVVIGVNWYSNFDDPVLSKGDHWIGLGDLGQVRGGHCVCVYGASDKLQAFRVKNSWGRAYPLVWLTYSAMQRLLHEQGEAALVTDR